MSRAYPSPSDLACAVALSLGVMKREGTIWRFGRRRYSNDTAARAVLHGVGAFHGNELRAAAPKCIAAAPQPSLTRAGGLA